MPELPEVETIKRDLENHLPGLFIEDIRIHDARVIRDIDQGQFVKTIKGCRINAIDRRGKAIIIQLEVCGYLVIQLKMTGQLIYGEDLKTIENLKETKVTFKLSDGHYLNYNDQRLFGRLSFVKRLEDHLYLQSIGIEPLSDGFNAQWLKKELKQRKTPVKMLLMKQEFLAGIGNIYASEILFHAGIHPKKLASKLNVSQVQSLYAETKDVLKRAIKFRGSSMRNYRDSFGEKGRFMSQIKVYGRENEACFNCKTPITRIVQGARSTFFCKKCQH